MSPVVFTEQDAGLPLVVAALRQYSVPVQLPLLTPGVAHTRRYQLSVSGSFALVVNVTSCPSFVTFVASLASLIPSANTGPWFSTVTVDEQPGYNPAAGFTKRVITTGGAYFNLLNTSNWTLLPGAKAILDQVAISLLGNSEAEVAIHGHTDNVGGAKYNQDLSLRRAESVKAYLVSLGIPAARMSSRGYGFVKPIADNATAQGRAKNRRIEFVRIK